MFHVLALKELLKNIELDLIYHFRNCGQKQEFFLSSNAPIPYGTQCGR